MEITEAKRKAMDEYLASPQNRLISAAGKRDVKTMKSTLSEVASVDEQEPWYGRTALQCAVDTDSWLK
ncbi:hypothetical protein [Comamonas sp. JUb58]|uniref:hypothetical protein n=1 Tax=Comamonas sp. JUb58 TaxID=2485114 RepID=UPI0014151818|nr:hypothetical protein [Comamonas sp. JUb58]